MTLCKQDVHGWPCANAKMVRATANWADANIWLCRNKADRIVLDRKKHPYGYDHECWERKDKTKPFEFKYGGERPLKFYPEAQDVGGCLDCEFPRGPPLMCKLNISHSRVWGPGQKHQ
eukprot:TRINITY_DN110570_c0_g1_i1.p2 TRINITY_DN110570_c0_g1~~TRINITY_DN110570_c0_g1_i1.p2  ORF type:complete len:118 (+),score=9.95 TRINITY_DN110570_c0_g1_i1:10-363(+)